MDPARVQKMTDQVSRLMADRLGARGSSLRERVDRKGGALPRRVRRAAEVLATAETMNASPKMARRIDLQGVSRAHAACVKYLRPLGAGTRRSGYFLGVAASIALGLSAIALAALAVMRWRGLI